MRGGGGVMRVPSWTHFLAGLLPRSERLDDPTPNISTEMRGMITSESQTSRSRDTCE